MPSAWALRYRPQKSVVITAVVIVLFLCVGIWVSGAPTPNAARLLSGHASTHGEQPPVALTNVTALEAQAEELENEIHDKQKDLENDEEKLRKEKKDLENDEEKLRNISNLIHSREEADISSFRSSANGKTKKKKNKQSKREAVGWGIASIICAIFIGLTCIICQCGCFVWCAFLSTDSLYAELKATLNLFGSFYEPLDGREKTALIIRREMRIMMILPLIPLMAFEQITCEEGAPMWVYYVYLLFLIRTKIIELRILRRVDFSWIYIPAFVVGAIDHSDFFTDGVFPVQAYKCDPSATERFALGFQHSRVPFLAPLVSTMHFYGVAYLVLSAAILSQQAMGTSELGDSAMAMFCAADIPGMAAAGKTMMRKDDDNEGFGAALSSVSKVLIENCSQLWLQSSYFGITFTLTTKNGKAKLLLSLGLGMVSATLKSCQTIYFLRKSVFYDTNPAGGNKLVFYLQFVSLALVAWTAAKLYFAFECESHLWNLTSGCIPLL